MDELARQAGMTGLVVAGLTALVVLMSGALSIAVKLKQLFVKEVNPDKEFVTRAELTEAMDGLKNDMQAKIESLKTDLGKDITDVGKHVTDLNNYIHTTAHAQNNSMHTIALKVERLVVVQELAMGKQKPEDK